jgi:hypothetical protein
MKPAPTIIAITPRIILTIGSGVEREVAVAIPPG